MRDLFIRTDRHRRVAARALELAERFAARAAEHDREGSFPVENFVALRASGYTRLTIPTRYGGEGGGVYDMVLAQNLLARGDGSTALSVGWHLFKMGQLAETGVWEEPVLERVYAGAVREGHLLNAIISEPETGSPSRGGRPTTRARLEGGQWVIDGRKIFSTMAQALHYFLVSAAIEGGEENGWFLVERGSAGIRIEETWDTLGMRATGSHDVILEGVRVEPSALVQRFGRSVPYEGAPGSGAGWNLHIPAVYLGIAEAARDWAVSFAARHRPNSLTGPIGELPGVQSQLGQIELELLAARTLLFTVAERWDAEPAHRSDLVAAVGGAKVFVVNAALNAVDRAMRVVGAQSLFRSNPLERYYRDLRAGLHNPPMEDAALAAMARAALKRVLSDQGK